MRIVFARNLFLVWLQHWYSNVTLVGIRRFNQMVHSEIQRPIKLPIFLNNLRITWISRFVSKYLRKVSDWRILIFVNELSNSLPDPLYISNIILLSNKRYPGLAVFLAAITHHRSLYRWKIINRSYRNWIMKQTISQRQPACVRF